MKRFSLLFLVFALSSASVFADEIKQEKKARPSDLADRYVLEKDGDLYRYFGSLKCAVTTKVTGFTVSQHPKDSAVIYFERNEGKDSASDLYALRNTDTNYSGNCSPTSKTKLVSDVKEYKMATSTDTDVVKVTLDRSGHLIAWGNENPRVEAYRVEDFMMNSCFNESGKPFKTYVAFAINSSKCVIKIKGDLSGDDAKVDCGGYSSIQDFKERNQIPGC